MTWKKTALLLAALAFVGTTTSACATKRKTGTLLGAGAGAAVGMAVSGGSMWGALAGAAVGGTAGNLIGKSMDQQAKELNQAVPTADVDRKGEAINMTFASDLMFDINSAELKQSYKDDLAAAATVFNKYADTNLTIVGHTDATGNDAINDPLSKRRAEAVEDYLASQGVAANRMTASGRGSNDPLFPNDTPENQAKNRRVEIGVAANENMVAAAEAGTL